MSAKEPANSAVIEEKLVRLVDSLEPDASFTHDLRVRIMERAAIKAQENSNRSTHVIRGRFYSAWRWGLAIAGMALLVAFLVFSIGLLPKSSLAPAGGSTPAALLPTASPTPQASPEVPLAALEGSGPQSPLSELPLNVGTRWVYTYTSYNPLPSDPTQIITATYNMTETVTQVKSEAPLFAAKVETERRLVSQSAQWTGADLSGSELSWYVIVGNKVYSGGQEPDLSNFEPDLSSQWHLAYQFPLSVGNKWCPVVYDFKSPDHRQIQDCSANGELEVAQALAYETPVGKFDDCYRAVLMSADPADGMAEAVTGCSMPLPDTAGYYGQVDWSPLYESCPQALDGAAPGLKSSLSLDSSADEIRQRILHPTWETLWLQSQATLYSSTGVQQNFYVQTGQFDPSSADQRWFVHPLESAGQAMGMLFPSYLGPRSEGLQIVAMKQQAGRSALVVDWAYFRLWVDAETGVLLRQQIRDENGEVNEDIAIQSIAYDLPLPEGLLSTENLENVRFEAPPVGASSSKPAPPETPAQASNPSKIIFSAKTSQGAEIFSVGESGGQPLQLTHDSDESPGVMNTHPACSLGAAWIAFTGIRDGQSDIFLMHPDGSGEIRLTDDLADDVDPAFSPDGGQIAFVSQRDGSSAIYIMTWMGRSWGASPISRAASPPRPGRRTVPGLPSHRSRMGFLRFTW